MVVVVRFSKALFSLSVAFSIVASGAELANAYLPPFLSLAESSVPVATSTTMVIGSAPTVFTWAALSPTVGSTMKLSKLVSSTVEGTRVYRVTGTCSLRKKMLLFKRTGRCRVMVSIKPKNGTKLVRSSKAILVSAKKTSYLHPKLSGTPEEQTKQMLPVITKVNGIKGYGPWVMALNELEKSVAPYGMTIWSDPATKIFKISVGGLTSCFRPDSSNTVIDKDEVLVPYSCAQDCLDFELKKKNPFPFYECRIYPQLELTGSPQERAVQVLEAIEKVATISDFTAWSDGLFQLNRSINSYYLYVDSPVNSIADIEKGKNRDWYFITQWYQSGQSSRTCFLWTNASGSVEAKYLKPVSCL